MAEADFSGELDKNHLKAFWKETSSKLAMNLYKIMGKVSKNIDKNTRGSHLLNAEVHFLYERPLF